MFNPKTPCVASWDTVVGEQPLGAWVAHTSAVHTLETQLCTATRRCSGKDSEAALTSHFLLVLCY